MFMPTGAYTLEHYTSGALKSPPEEDRKVIQSFIDSMNSLLPDDVVREKAEFKIEDMRFEVHSPRAIHAPPYYRREREVRRYSMSLDCIPLIRICFFSGSFASPSFAGFHRQWQ